jgi:hypothetical protein
MEIKSILADRTKLSRNPWKKSKILKRDAPKNSYVVRVTLAHARAFFMYPDPKIRIDWIKWMCTLVCDAISTVSARVCILECFGARNFRNNVFHNFSAWNWSQNKLCTFLCLWLEMDGLRWCSGALWRNSSHFWLKNYVCDLSMRKRRKKSQILKIKLKWPQMASNGRK